MQIYNGSLDVQSITNEWYDKFKDKNCGALITFVGAFLVSRSSAKVQLRTVRVIGWLSALSLGALLLAVMAGVVL